MEEKLNRRPHKLEVTGRGTGSVTGIQDVVSFDENQPIPPMRITANQENPCLTGCSNNKKRRAKMG